MLKSVFLLLCLFPSLVLADSPTNTMPSLAPLFEEVFESLPRGQKLLKEFDSQLEQKVVRGDAMDLFAEPSYKKLLALRGLTDHNNETLATMYLQAFRSLNSTKNSENKTEILREFHRQFLSATDWQQFALRSLYSRLQEGLVDIETHNKALRNNQFLIELKSLLKISTARSVSQEYREILPAIDAEASRLSEDTELARKLAVVESADVGFLKEQRNTFKNITGSSFADGKWVLTFDDGPHKTISDKVRKVLKSHSTKATFFELSKNVKALPSVADSIISAGHSIGSHSVDHADLSKLGAAALKAQVSGSRDAIEKSLHDQGHSSYAMKYFRAPYGAGIFSPKSKALMDAIANAGLIHVLWNVDSLDWQDKDSESVKNRVVKQMKAQKKGIILFHDIQAATPDSLDKLFKSDFVKESSINFSNL